PRTSRRQGLGILLRRKSGERQLRIPLLCEAQAPLALEKRRRTPLPIFDQLSVGGQLGTVELLAFANDSPRQRVRLVEEKRLDVVFGLEPILCNLELKLADRSSDRLGSRRS